MGDFKNHERKDKKEKQITNEPAAEERTAQSGPAEIVGINFREAGKIYYFSPKSYKFNVGDRVIVQTTRGVEIGTVKVANKMVEGADIVSPLKPVMRPATEDDLAKDAANHQAEMDAAVICKKKIKTFGFPNSLKIPQIRRHTATIQDWKLWNSWQVPFTAFARVSAQAAPSAA